MAIIFLTFIVESLLFFILKSTVDIGILTIFSIAINAVVFVYVFSKSTKSKLFLTFLIVSYILRLSLLLFDLYGNDLFLLPHSGADTEYYHYFAMSIFNNPINLSSIPKGYYTIIVGSLYKVFGVNRIMAQYFNLVLSMCIPLIFLDIVRILKIEEKKIRLPFFIVCFFPQFLIFSAILLREAIIIFLLTLSLKYFIKWFVSDGRKNILLNSIMVFLAMIFHSGLVVFFIVYLFLYLFYDRSKNRINVKLKTLIISIIILGLFVTIGILYQDIFLVKFRFLLEGNYERLLYTFNYSKGESVYLVNMHYDSFWDVLIYSLPRTFYFLFSPMLWDIRNLLDFTSFILDSCLYIYLIYKVVVNINKMNQMYKCLVRSLFTILLLFSFLYAQATITAGTAIRHRSNILIILVIIYIVILNARNVESQQETIIKR